MTREEVLSLNIGDIVIDTTTGKRWKVNGKNQRVKTVRIPVKHGLYTYGYIFDDNLHLLTRG